MTTSKQLDGKKAARSKLTLQPTDRSKNNYNEICIINKLHVESFALDLVAKAENSQLQLTTIQNVFFILKFSRQRQEIASDKADSYI